MKKLLLILLYSSTLPLSAYAVSIPGKFYANQTGGVKNINSVGALVSTLLPNIIIAAGVIFFILMVLGAFGLIVSAGREANPQMTAKAKAAVTSGFVGFLIIVTAYFILQLVQTATGVNLTNPNL
ncbi:hypothetical protein HYW29_00035 [Candidatus Amesbacteria bacterium]|nr:hypothetical protein [Candidatus Amesbacteria bacterium]